MNMAKPPRSPLLGYNHNVKYEGHIFHVQTEDSGPGNPHIFTHLFFEGSILASKRSQYEASAAEDDVRAVMQSQHKAILKELKQKTYDDRILAFFETRGDTFGSEDLAADAVPTAASEAEITEASPLPAPDEPAEEPAVLDLDALPGAASAKGPTPEPLPIHLTKPAVPGPGTYTFRRATRDQFPVETAPPPQSPTPAASRRPSPTRPITPVVVQRQVVVGTGAPQATNTRKVPTTPVRRRPVSGGPYVVKEGSHANIPATSQRIEAKPMTAASEPARAPRSAEPQSQEGAPASLVTDQSLDDVILAYLSQGEGKR